MSDRYWVGGTGTWNASNTTNWSTSSGGSGGASVPTSADNVFFNASSGGGALTVSTGAIGLTLDFTGYTGSVALSSGMNIHGGLILDSTMGAITGGGSFYQFLATTDNGGAGWPIRFNGKLWQSGNAGVFNFNGAGGKWTFQDTIYLGNSTEIRLSAGTLDTNSQTVTALSFVSSVAGARTLTLGSSAITLTGPTPWNVGGVAPTVTANTAVVTFTGNAGAMTMGGVNYNGVSFVFTGITAFGGPAFTGHFTVGNLTFTGTANKGTSATFAGSVTCTTSFIANGNSAVNRFWVNANTPGTAITITAPSTTLTNVDFMDITGAGGGSWSGTSIGDCLGNTGITFDTPVTRYAVAAGNVSSTAMWSTTNGGSAGASVPLPQDSVYFTSSSGAGTYTFDMPRIGRDKDFTGFTRTVTYTSGMSFYHFGSVILSSAMTFTAVNTSVQYFMGRGTHTIVSAGKSFFPGTSNGGVNVFAVGGSYTLGDAFYNFPGTFTLNSGTFDTASYSLTVGSLVSATSSTRAMLLGASIVTLLQTSGGNWTMGGTGMTMSAASATISFGVAFNGSRTFSGNGYTYGTLDYTVANSPGTLAISGANVIGTLNIGPGRTVTGQAGTVGTVGTLNATGQNNGYLYIRGGSGDYAAVPDAAQNQITGDIDIRVDMAPDSWTAGTAGAVMGKDSVGGAGRVWQMGLTAAGFPTFTWWDSSGTLRGTFTASAAAPFTGNTRSWLRVTLDVDNGSGGHALKFWTSPAGTPVWTQLGSTISAGAFTTSMRNQSALVAVGSAGGGGANPAKFYRAQIRNNILDDGTGIVLDMDFTAKPFGANTFTESSTNAAVVTLAGNAIVGDGRVALASGTAAAQMFLSLQGARQTFNYLTVRDVFSTVPYKFYAGANSVDVSGNTNVTFTAAPVGEPYLAFDVEAILVVIGTGGTLNLVIPPGQAVLPGDTLVFALNTVNDHGTAAVSGYTPITPAKVMDTATAISVLTKTAVGGESSATWTSGNGSAGTPHLMVVRGLTDTLVDVVDSAVTGGGSPASSITTGSGVTNTAVPALALALWAANGTMSTFVSVSNGFQISRLGSADTGYYGRGAVKPLSSVASQTSTLTWTSARRAVGRMVVLKSTPTGNQAGLLAFFM